ncbi:MAG TPA: histidine--tRNA ligase [Candidatus Acidoferrum sp.]|nr:histidine--tRNA ligase [Candidatus Acidoferrum sp.]
MATKPKFQAIKGTRDLLPPETALWHRVEHTAHEVFATFGFGEIRLPIFEPTELFARSIGLETDIVGKEMYSFPLRPTTDELVTEIFEKDPKSFTPGGEFIYEREKLEFEAKKKGESISLRPEATASVCRAYIEHNMNQLPQPMKLYYMGPMFRRERPQKGRYRQFYQIGAEVLGGPDAPAIDAEVIEMVMTFFAKLDLQGVQLDINSIGCKNCRPKYVELLRAELQKVKDKLGEDSKRRIDTNPLRVLDSKLETEQPIIETLPRISDHLCDECKSHYSEVKRQLDLRGVAYRENWRLVRGLDYYMRTTFEITAGGLGSQNAVCGGGRYDGLIELLGGSSSTAGGTKGIGFAIGEDRLILSLQESGKSPNPAGRDVYIAWMGERAQSAAIRAAKALRSAGFSVELPPVEQKFGKALGQADKLGAKFALILGDNEVSSGEWTLKVLADSSQQKLTESRLLEFLRKRRAESY